MSLHINRFIDLIKAQESRGGRDVTLPLKDAKDLHADITKLLLTLFSINNARSLSMSRPKPSVLIEHTNKQTYKTEQVLASEGVWAVFYDSKPINLKTSNMLTQYPGPKYKKVSFSNPGHAINLARKLNAQFKTDKFSVVLLTQGAQVFPNAQ